ncbi:hypothetical protein FB567DRAFT_215179 [Paraphoma chrysanthemicola]|uniref:Uncharacterized protein n=1 Tax=Paraphoma chrysanthemicola TaxID=798071 RepID=A0A8K0QTR4_9PLEO|nr:hypothetical protein FB567DRAFT_215179 [Paraphoma chrysanthemicola]
MTSDSMAPTQSLPLCAYEAHSATDLCENETTFDHHSSPHNVLSAFHHLTLAPPTPRFAGIHEPPNVPRDLTRYDLTQGPTPATAAAYSPHLQVSRTAPINPLAAVRHSPNSVRKLRSLRVKKKVMRERSASTSPKMAFGTAGLTSQNTQPWQTLKWMQPSTASMMEAQLCAPPSKSGNAEGVDDRRYKAESKADSSQICLFQSRFSDYESSPCSSDSSGGKLL